MASPEIDALTQALARLPGLGPRSARRAVLHLLKKRESALGPLQRALEAVNEKLASCTICGNVDTSDPCGVCADPRRDARMLCVVEEVADLYRQRWHVELHLRDLKSRLQLDVLRRQPECVRNCGPDCWPITWSGNQCCSRQRLRVASPAR